MEHVIARDLDAVSRLPRVARTNMLLTNEFQRKWAYVCIHQATAVHTSQTVNISISSTG